MTTMLMNTPISKKAIPVLLVVQLLLLLSTPGASTGSAVPSDSCGATTPGEEFAGSCPRPGAEDEAASKMPADEEEDATSMLQHRNSMQGEALGKKKADAEEANEASSCTDDCCSLYDYHRKECFNNCGVSCCTMVGGYCHKHHGGLLQVDNGEGSKKEESKEVQKDTDEDKGADKDEGQGKDKGLLASKPAFVTCHTCKSRGHRYLCVANGRSGCSDSATGCSYHVDCD